MRDEHELRRAVEAAVSEVIGHVSQQLCERVLSLVRGKQEQREPTAILVEAARAIEAVQSQSDILQALLTASSNFAPRCAIFVMRPQHAVLWQAAGFGTANLRTTTLPLSANLIARALQTFMAVSGSPAQFDATFNAVAGTPPDAICTIVPLLIREKVAAFIYADSGVEGEVNVSALDLLARFAGLRIESGAAKRSAGTSVVAAAATGAFAAAAPPACAPAENALAGASASPNAVVSGTQASGATSLGSSSVIPQTDVAVQPPAVTSVSPAAVLSSTAPTVPAVPPPDEMTAKACRFAKLLVDEIKLYNQAKVIAGRQNADLYDRLRDDIEKSREAYNKRFGATPVCADYFAQELVRNLADNNSALLGANFPR